LPDNVAYESGNIYSLSNSCAIQRRTLLFYALGSFQLILPTVSLPRRFLRMASTAAPKPPTNIPLEDLSSFHTQLSSSKRILALLGAGLSASSGLATFRGASGLWRTHDAMQLATPEAFDANPALVWQFYNYRRHMAMKARPNPAHYALAELAKKREGFQTLSQNTDGTFTCFCTMVYAISQC
jgi:hypothetical protein